MACAEQSPSEIVMCGGYRYLVESIRRFPDMVSFAEEVQDAGLRFVDYKSLSGGVVAIHWGYKL